MFGLVSLFRINIAITIAIAITIIIIIIISNIMNIDIGNVLSFLLFLKQTANLIESTPSNCRNGTQA